MRSLHRCAAALAACLPLLAAASPTSPGAPRPQTQAAIQAENAKWSAAFARGDYQAIGRLYTHDGALLPPGAERVVGGSAITAYFVKGYAAAKPDTVSFSNAEFYGDERSVTEVSDAEIHGPDGQLKLRAKQTLVFLKQGGAWKLHRDMWSDYATQP